MIGNPTIVNPATVRDMVPFSYQDIQLKEACWINGRPYYTRRAIGIFLALARPQEGVDRIIQRNPYIRQFSVHVNLTCTDGKAYDVEAYDPIGLQLIIFESNQPKAREYKVAVAHLVWAYMNGKLHAPVDPGYGPQLRALDLVPYGQKTLAVEVLAEVRHCVRATIYRHRAMDRKGQDPSAKRYPTLIDRWDRRFPREKAIVLAALAEGWQIIRIWRNALGAPAQPSLYMVSALARRIHLSTVSGA
jgi:hypothetical protein